MTLISAIIGQKVVKIHIHTFRIGCWIPWARYWPSFIWQYSEKRVKCQFFSKQNKYLTNIYLFGFFFEIVLNFGVTRLLVASAAASPMPSGILVHQIHQPTPKSKFSRIFRSITILFYKCLLFICYCFFCLKQSENHLICKNSYL